MSSTGINNGTIFAIYIGGTKVSNGTSNNFSTNLATRNATTKDSAGWQDNLEAVLSWTASVEGFIAENATYGFTAMFNAQITRAKVGVIMKGAVGDKQYAGNAYIPALTRTSPVEDSETFSLTLIGTGALTETTTT